LLLLRDWDLERVAVAPSDSTHFLVRPEGELFSVRRSDSCIWKGEREDKRDVISIFTEVYRNEKGECDKKASLKYRSKLSQNRRSAFFDMKESD
jgi:hypothetical protein